jgi:hypothetical protein
MMCIPFPGKRMDRRCEGFSEVSDRFSVVFEPFDTDHSFAGRNEQVQSIALMMLHPMMYHTSPGKRFQIQKMENNWYHHDHDINN